MPPELLVYRTTDGELWDNHGDASVRQRYLNVYNLLAEHADKQTLTRIALLAVMPTTVAQVKR
jgi:hypothetical protein